MTPAPQIQLFSMRLLADASEQFPVTEETVRLCMDPLWLPNFDNLLLEQEDGSVVRFDERIDGGVEVDSHLSGMVHALLRTGGIYCLPEDCGDAMKSAWDGETPDLPELPPLPFPRIVLEGRSDDNPVPLLCDESLGNNLILIGITEHARGECWHVVLVHEGWIRSDERAECHMEEHDGCSVCDGSGFLSSDLTRRLYAAREEAGMLFDYPEATHLRLRATPDGTHVDQFQMGSVVTEEFLAQERIDWDALRREKGWCNSRRARAAAVGLAVTAVHLITAVGVTHAEQRLPRPQRREIGRRLQLLQPPRIYFVNLESSQKHEPSGVSDRSYHVRWLVRGHWRRNPHGDTFIRAKGAICVWVRPHIKGPPGARWKGRPVHTFA